MPHPSPPIPVALAASVALLALPALAQLPGRHPTSPARRGPVTVVIGASIGGVFPGMTRAGVQALGYALTPETTARADGTGWISGAMHFVVDSSDRVTVVSLDLRRSAGITVAGRRIPRTASLADIARAVGGCTQSQGSGGNALECRDGAGRATHFYDSAARDEVTVVMP